MRSNQLAKTETANQHDVSAEMGLVCASARDWLDFAAHLARKNLLHGDPLAITKQADLSPSKIRALFPSTRLSADDYADEIAAFFRLGRIGVRELLSLQSRSDEFSHKYLRENLVFPCVSEAGEELLVVADPTDRLAIQGAELVLRSTAKLMVASFEDISTALAACEEVRQNGLSHEIAPISQDIDDVDGLRDLASGAPVVNAVNDLFERALQLRATDIHVEPFRSECAIRLRVDGVMRSIASRSDISPSALLSRIKILAGLNIAERRLPQDGAAHIMAAGSSIDCRVATMPTKFGESAVIRLLPKNRGILEFSKLGLGGADYKRMTELLQLPHGLIVVTGPTGSGKTTTLATMLTRLNDQTRKILTIEDPIEYEIPGINQSQVRPDIGLTFAAALRSFVRQDPDVIMVGEIRDSETAQIAIHAALTGHLVLTTLHTESAAAAIPRLIDLGVEPFLLQSTLRGVVAQRLARILCESCRSETILNERMLDSDPRYALVGFRTGDRVYEATGCERCSGTGYRGRIGLFEILPVGHAVRELIATRSDPSIVASAAKSAGMTALVEDGAAKCRRGLTSVQELLRVATIG